MSVTNIGKPFEGIGGEKRIYIISSGQSQSYHSFGGGTAGSPLSLGTDKHLTINPFFIIRGWDMDIYNLNSLLERERKKMEVFSDRDIILKFLTHMELSGIGKVQLIKYCQGIRCFSSVLKSNPHLMLSSATPEDLENFLISMKGLKPKTQKIRWYAVKKFFDYIGRGEIFSGFDIKFERSKNKLPEDILTKEEVGTMINSCRNFRNIVFISLLYESGCRISELLTRKVGDVKFDDKGGILMVNGKTGERVVRLIKSTQLLEKYIEGRPKDEILFRISYGNSRKILRHAAKKAGITKKIHPHIFRHSRATHLASILTEAQMNAFFGWTQGSAMPRIYVHMSGRDIDDALLKEI